MDWVQELVVEVEVEGRRRRRRGRSERSHKENQLQSAYDFVILVTLCSGPLHSDFELLLPDIIDLSSTFDPSRGAIPDFNHFSA